MAWFLCWTHKTHLTWPTCMSPINIWLLWLWFCSWQNQSNRSPVILVFSGCVILFFSLFWGRHDPHCFSTYCGACISALYTTSTYLTTPIFWVLAPPSLPCSPPSSCLDPFLLSQASPLHRDRLRSHDDGGMHSCGRSLFELNGLKGYELVVFFFCFFNWGFVPDHLVQESADLKLHIFQETKSCLSYKQQWVEPKHFFHSVSARMRSSLTYTEESRTYRCSGKKNNRYQDSTIKFYT